MRHIVRGAATVVGLAGGVVLAPLSLVAMFTLRNEDLPEGIVALATPLLLLPLVTAAAVRPRIGGQVLIGAAALSAAAYLWSLAGASSTPEDIIPMLGLYASVCALGAAFWWSGRAAPEGSARR